MTGIGAAFDPRGRQGAITVCLIVLAMILGGGGSPNPATELALGLIFGACAIALLWMAATSPRLPNDRLLWLVLIMILLVPALQLIPLPPSIWQSLPGREPQMAALALVGAADSWQPFTTSVPRTVASLLALVPPLMLMILVASLPLRQRRWVIGAIAAVALLSAGLGAMQLAAGPSAPRLYEASSDFVVTGFHANRNAAVDVLLIGILALATYAVGRSAEGKHRPSRVAYPGIWVASGVAVLGLAAILTASRAGIALIPLTLLVTWAILALDPARRWNRYLGRIAIGVTAAIVAAAVALQTNAALGKVVQRFVGTGDNRSDLWQDTLYVIGQYWPLGTGIGTFVPNFIALEPLEAVDPSAPNRAHNDYLELALEAGVLGIALWALVAIMVASMAIRAWRQGGSQRVQALFGLGTLLIVAGHSVVDYPLRSMALASLAAVAVGLFTLPPLAEGTSAPARVRAPRAAPRLALTALALAFLFAAWGSGLDRMSQAAPTLDRLVPGPFRANAERSAATMALTRGELDSAKAHATAAVKADPLDPLSTSLLGAARQLAGDEQGAAAAFRISAQRGWRDRLAQLYWYDIALRMGDVDHAAMRADALMRSDPEFLPAASLLEPLEATEAGRTALARRLAENPVWVSAYANTEQETDAAVVARRAQVLTSAAREGQPLGCDIPRWLAKALLDRGMRREAEDLWAAHCTDGRSVAGLSDGSFEMLAVDERPTPFGWVAHRDGDVEIEAVEASGGGSDAGKALRLRNGASVTRLVLTQAIAATPGTYRVRAAIRAEEGAPVAPIAFSLDCDGAPRRPASIQGEAGAAGQILAVGQCPRPVLGLWLRPQSGPVVIDDVRLERTNP